MNLINSCDFIISLGEGLCDGGENVGICDIEIGPHGLNGIILPVFGALKYFQNCAVASKDLVTCAECLRPLVKSLSHLGMQFRQEIP